MGVESVDRTLHLKVENGRRMSHWAAEWVPQVVAERERENKTRERVRRRSRPHIGLYICSHAFPITDLTPLSLSLSLARRYLIFCFPASLPDPQVRFVFNLDLFTSCVDQATSILRLHSYPVNLHLFVLVLVLEFFVHLLSRYSSSIRIRFYRKTSHVFLSYTISWPYFGCDSVVECEYSKK